eukprot:scaffold166794_cov32-Tisochrysis_lutea.AAC.5
MKVAGCDCAHIATLEAWQLAKSRRQRGSPPASARAWERSAEAQSHKARTGSESRSPRGHPLCTASKSERFGSQELARLLSSSTPRPRSAASASFSKYKLTAVSSSSRVGGTAAPLLGVIAPPWGPAAPDECEPYWPQGGRAKSE